MEKSKPSQCPKCHEKTLWRNEGISKKNNKPYANVKCSSCQYLEWLPVEEKSKPAPEGWQKPFQGIEKKVDPNMMILEEIQVLRKEVKQLIKLVVSNLGEEEPPSFAGEE